MRTRTLQWAVVIGGIGWGMLAACTSDTGSRDLPEDFGSAPDASSGDPPVVEEGTDLDAGGGSIDTGPAVDSAPPIPYKARAVFVHTGLNAGSPAGSIDFDELGGEITVTARIAGAQAGSHGMHIHEGTSCANNAQGPAGAALGHWNPADASAHGLPDAAMHHPGDLGNFVVPMGGAGETTLKTTGFTVAPGAPDTAIGHAVIFHAGPDDGTSQPAGNSGGRASCGIIEARP